MEFAAELQASLREFTLAAACARIELPRSDLWRSHHSSQELRRHRRVPSPALDAQLAVELYEHDPALNILKKIDPDAPATGIPGLSRNANRKLSSIRRGLC